MRSILATVAVAGLAAAAHADVENGHFSDHSGSRLCTTAPTSYSQTDFWYGCPTCETAPAHTLVKPNGTFGDHAKMVSKYNGAPARTTLRQFDFQACPRDPDGALINGEFVVVHMHVKFNGDCGEARLKVKFDGTVHEYFFVDTLGFWQECLIAIPAPTPWNPVVDIDKIQFDLQQFAQDGSDPASRLRIDNVAICTSDDGESFGPFTTACSFPDEEPSVVCWQGATSLIDYGGADVYFPVPHACPCIDQLSAAGTEADDLVLRAANAIAQLGTEFDGDNDVNANGFLDGEDIKAMFDHAVMAPSDV